MMRENALKSLRLVLIGLGVLLVVSGTLTTAFAQDKFTACVNKKGKIRRLALGNEPLKGCKGRQIEIMFPNTQKTDGLTEDVTNLDEKTGLLMEKDMQLMEDVTDLDEKTGLLMEKDMELMRDIDDLNSDVTAIQAEIDGSIAEALASLQSQIDNITASSLIGGDMDFFQQIGPEAPAYLAMFGSNVHFEENSATQNMAAPGILTNLFVRSNPPGENNTVTFTLRTGNIDTLLSCTIGGVDDECSVTDICVQINQGDLISLQAVFQQGGDPPPVFGAIVDVRWNSRFVENGTCPDA